MLTRREFTQLTIGTLALPALGSGQSVVSGVRLGVQTYSFRDLPRTPGGDASDAMKYSPSPTPITIGLPFRAAIISSGASLLMMTMA